MAPRKRNPAPKPVRQTPVDGTASSRSEDLPWIPDPKPPSPEVKAECERALTSLRRGNHTKALRLMKEACGRHESSALLHRVHGTVSVKVASLLDDPAAKLRHLRAGVESARRAAALSPSSVEFAHFHATLLYEAASDGRGYEEVVQECERALSVSDPVDPAVESLQEESQQKLATPEARISHVQQELRALIQKSNIASISTWMKNLGNGVGGEEKFRLIPMRRLSEDPMEVRIVPSRRPNEIKKANKTPEERRKEIEVRVAAARLIQQKPDSSPNQEDPSPSSSSSSSSRRKLMNSRKVTSSGDRTDQVRSYWNSMTIDQRLGFLIVGVPELKAHFALSSKDGFAVLSEALSFVEANGTWEFWACCRCDEKSTDCDSHTQHVVREHTGSLSPKFQSVLPQEVDAEWIEMLIGGSWRPVDASAAVKMLEDEQLKFQTDDSDAQDKDCPSEYWSPKENSDSSTSSSSPQQQESEERSSCNGFAMGNKKKDGSNYERWPLSDDTERAKLLERIQGMFQSLVKHKSLSVSHLNKVIQFAMEEIQSLPSGSLLMNHALDQSPICIHFLGASQLRKVLKFLQELSQSCGLGRYSEKDNTIVDAKSVASKARSDPLEGVSLVCDSSSLFLGGRLFHGENVPINANSTHLDEVTESVPDTNALISWLFTGPPSGEQLVAWTRMREESSHQGMEILQMLEKEFYLLQSMCERKCEHLSYEEALQAVENLCVDEFKKREHAVKFTARSYESVLRKRQEELIERENEVMFVGSRFELDAISNVLKEAQAFNASQFGYDETLSGMTSRLCELESGEDDEWRVNDFLHQADTCIEVAIQRQKEHLIVELSKIDARIMRNVNGMQQLELKLGPASAFDYRTIVLPLLKSFLRVLLEDLVDKDATEKSDAAREAFLAELALDAKKNGIKGVDPKQIQEKPKDKKKNKDYKKSKDIKAMGFNEDHILHQESQECEFLDDADLIESKLIETGDCSGQHEVEFNRKVELEAEERKLEETLEYQRRIEDEAKQKHLAELFKNGPGTYQDSVTKEASVFGSDLSVGYQGPWGKLSYHNQASLRNDTSAVCLKGITFGDFHCSEAAVQQNHQNVEFEQSENSLVSKDPLQNVEPQNLVHHNEESYTTYTDDVKPFGQNIRVPSTSEGLKLNGIERTQGSARSFSSSSQQKNKSTSSYSKHNQGTFGNLQEGFGLSEQRASRQSKKRSSSKVHDGNAQSSPHELGDNRANTLEKLPAEDDDEERFQADLKKAVRQSLDTFQAQKNSLVATVSRLHPDVDVSGAPVTELASISSGKDVFGTGLRNAVGEYNCFLNVIIQSLWHIRRFRDEFLRTSPLHVHVGNPCVVCALYDIFTALTKASEEAVSPTCLRIALSNLYPDSNFFQEAQMNDASEVLAVIFDCLHKSFTSSGDCDMESDGSNCTGRWDCSSTTCIAHTFFGMDIYEQMNCNICGLESRHMKYTSFFHNINANALRTMKITCADSSFDELLKNVEMNHQVACDLETGGCGNPNYIHHILSSPPHVFTTVLGWQNMNESAEDISATLTALNTEVEIGVLYRGLDQGIKHSLVSLVCYYGQHYHCFAYENDRWVMYDDQTVKAIGSWGDVLTMCERGHLQPQVLFYESHN